MLPETKDTPSSLAVSISFHPTTCKYSFSHSKMTSALGNIVCHSGG